jgi:hypothetical protein
MPSSFSPNLRLELIANGEQAGNWGATTNTNLGTLLESSIAGFQTVSVIAADQALTTANGAADQARNAMLRLTTTTGAAFGVYAPPSSKQYTVFNDSAHAATIFNSTSPGNTTAAGTGITIPAGRTLVVFTDGTNFRTVDVVGLTGVLAVANGGTGATTAAGARTNLGTVNDPGSNGILVRTAANTTTPRSVAVSGTGLSVTNGDGVSGNPTIASNATSANTNSTIVARDASGNFSAGTITATLSGNVTGNLNGNLTATAPTAPTAAAGTNNTQVATTAFVQAALQALHPVGSIYINATNSANPATYFGFGTWVAFGAGRVPVGFNSADALFNAAEKTGGTKDAIVVSHTHTVTSSGTTGGQSVGHTHTFSGTTSGQSANHVHTGTTASEGAHTHNTTIPVANSSGTDKIEVAGGDLGTRTYTTSIAGNHNHAFTTGAASSDHTHGYSGTTSGVSSDHTHNVTVSGTTASAGSSGTNANLQPYITVFMWKRTA